MKNLFQKKSWLVLMINLMVSLIIIGIYNFSLWYFITISLYFFILGTISYWYLNKKFINKPKRFISQYMLVSMIRLILHLSILIILFIYFKDRFLIAGLFFSNYIISTIYEASIWTSQKNKN